MSLTNDEVKHIAKLAALELSEEDLEKVKGELNDILGYVDQLQNVSTEGVAPTSHVHGVINAFRDDVVKPSLNLEDVKRNAPDIDEAGFKVPKILSSS